MSRLEFKREDRLDITEAMKEAYAYADPEITTWETFEFTNAGWPGEPILLVNSTRVLVTADGTFNPVKFEASLPETESSVRGQLQLTIGFLPSLLCKKLWAASQTVLPVYLYYRQYIEEGPSAEASAELPVPLVVNTVQFSDEQTVINALYPDLVNIPMGRRIMTATQLPGGRA